MSENITTQIRVPKPGDEKPESAHSRLQELGRRVNDLIDLLRAQRQILQQRGMNLPGNSLDSLRALRTRVEGLSKQVLNSQIELGSLRALADTSALINSTLETSEVLNQVMDTVVHLTGAERGYIVLRNMETDELEFSTARGLDQAQLDGGQEFVVSKTIVNDVFTSGEPVLTDNASQDERYQGRQSVVGFALRSILAVPLKVRDTVIGVVYCDNRILRGLFKQSELELLNAFAHQAGVAIENARLFEATRARLAEVTEMRDLMDDIFASIASGVITTDRENTVLQVNNAATTILGLDDDVAGRALQDIFPPLDDEFYESLQYVLDTGEQQTIEGEVELNGGGTRYWQVIASPLRDAEGRNQGVALVLDDLTEQKAHEAQIAEVLRYVPKALVDNIRSLDDVDVGGQERVITALSTDVRGFTNFSEHLEPEELMEVINQYLRVASDSILLYEGIVDKYMGDAVVGLFNTQLNPQEDHARRAVQTAMTILYDLYALHEVLPEEQCLFYGIGIHTGAAVLGNVGSEDRKEFTALGEAMDISKFLEGNAYGGDIIISPSTYELVKDTYECEERAPHKMKKGFEDITTVYKVLKRKKGVTTGQLFLDPELAELLNDDED